MRLPVWDKLVLDPAYTQHMTNIYKNFSIFTNSDRIFCVLPNSNIRSYGIEKVGSKSLVIDIIYNVTLKDVF